MTVAFTGTRAGMSAVQRDAFERLVVRLNPVWFHHGGARGADREAEAIVRRACPLTRVREFQVLPGDASPLVRNRRIVEGADVVVAAPRTDAEEVRSGTWATVRYARKRGLLVKVLSR